MKFLLEICPSLPRHTTDDNGALRPSAPEASALRTPHAPFLRPALTGTAVDAAPGIHWRSWEKLVPTKNQPELAITAVESERIASMSPLVAAAIEAAVESQEPPRCSHFAQNLWVVLADLDPLWLTTACGSRRLPRTQFALCTFKSDICDIAHSASHSCMRLCTAHPGTTLDIVHAERQVADHRANIGPDDPYGAGELMVTLATRSPASGRAVSLMTPKPPTPPQNPIGECTSKP
jgi:hypothetical protein